MTINNFEQWFQEVKKLLCNFEMLLAKPSMYEIDLNRIDPNNYAESLKQLLEESDPEYDKLSQKIYLIFNQIFNAYFTATTEQQKEIEETFQNKKHILKLLVSYPSFVATFIHSPKDIIWLKAGLIAAAIEDGRTDYRDLWISLGDLYIKAENCGIDPIPHISYVILTMQSHNNYFLYSDEDRNILTDFLESDYLKSIIKQTNK